MKLFFNIYFIVATVSFASAQIIDASVCNAAYGEPHYNERNYGDYEYLSIVSWTANAHGVKQFDWFSFISEKYLQKNWKSISSLKLVLHKRSGHKYFAGGQYGENRLRIFPITDKWKESKVTWDNKPAINSQISIEVNPRDFQDKLEIDLTPIIKKLGKDKCYGFAILLVEFNPNASCLFYSTDTEHKDLKPRFIYE